MDKDILATFRDLTTLLKSMTNLLGEHAERLDRLEGVVPLPKDGNLGDSAGETSDDTAEGDLGDVPGFAVTAELGDLLGKLLEVVADLDKIDVAGGVVIKGVKPGVELVNHALKLDEQPLCLILLLNELVENTPDVADSGIQVSASCDGDYRHDSSLLVGTRVNGSEVKSGFSSPRHTADPTGREPHNEGEQ